MSFFKKIQYNSPVILTFTFLCLVALLLNFATNGITNQVLFSVYESPFYDPLTYFRLLFHIVGHANFEHFFSNFMLILLIGPILEEKYGSWFILIMMVITSVVTGLLNILFFDTALLGASGIVFMFVILGSFVNLQKGRIPLTFILVIVIFIGREVVEGIFSMDSVSQLTHIMGGMCGAIIGFFINYVKGKNSEKADGKAAEVVGATGSDGVAISLGKTSTTEATTEPNGVAGDSKQGSAKIEVPEYIGVNRGETAGESREAKT